jgi:hypothetical protein
MSTVPAPEPLVIVKRNLGYIHSLGDENNMVYSSRLFFQAFEHLLLFQIVDRVKRMRLDDDENNEGVDNLNDDSDD